MLQCGIPLTTSPTMTTTTASPASFAALTEHSAAKTENTRGLAAMLLAAAVAAWSSWQTS